MWYFSFSFLPHINIITSAIWHRQVRSQRPVTSDRCEGEGTVGPSGLLVEIEVDNSHRTVITGDSRIDFSGGGAHLALVYTGRSANSRHQRAVARYSRRSRQMGFSSTAGVEKRTALDQSLSFSDMKLTVIFSGTW